jgi:hypothetical protein
VDGESSDGIVLLPVILVSVGGVRVSRATVHVLLRIKLGWM